MRPIDADSLEKTLRDWIGDHWTDAFTGDDAGSEFADMIEHEEAIERSPIAHAHWITKYPNKRTGKAYSHTCSKCGKTVYDSRQVSIDEMGYYFCPYCGARMDGKDGEQDEMC